ncbi:TetR/AcrR family transcriptional regulator [Paraburkholderia megapolitana]|uniref:Transcriptional regulator, TetR family n=1 Tax=Paraburkholderia megapolitana TaxID=420953 RepID=A0A1I3DR15_9BURK|nr:TetR/AcrR family transcriptional regulator [Paraburkholderia megapolitana]QDQ79715.1 TetR/AcrR family transcriptional regulator [Paraburkholderia megapolitana]SFH88941.1 transcriptional regulator, TetR family [Paraburkholderia megapolitana]
MARPRSEDKRNAILSAATKAVATLGVEATTAKIAKGAGVAEGTLFTYFDSKDVLFNELYLDLKHDLRGEMTRGYPAAGSVVERGRHVWDRYIDWGVAYPFKRKAMSQLSISERITEHSRDAGMAAFGEINAMVHQISSNGPLKDQSPLFVAAMMNAIAEATMEFIEREPKQAKRYKAAGFQAFWSAVAGV